MGVAPVEAIEPLLLAERDAPLESDAGPRGVRAEWTDCLSRARQAFDRTIPRAAEELALRCEPICQQWEARGPGLMRNLSRLIGSDLAAPDSLVLLVIPALGGGGRAVMSQRLVALEAVLANPLAELPEVVRLGWLLARSAFVWHEAPPGSRSHSWWKCSVAIALLPPILAAAAEVELISGRAPIVEKAINAWAVEPADAERIAAWWQRYQAQKPPWQCAVIELGEMLA